MLHPPHPENLLLGPAIDVAIGVVIACSNSLEREGKWTPSQRSGYARAGAITLVEMGKRG